MVKTMSAADLATSVAPATAIPVSAFLVRVRHWPHPQSYQRYAVFPRAVQQDEICILTI
jgi:hypothetical protein